MSFRDKVKALRSSLFAPVTNAISLQCQIETEDLVLRLLANQKYSDPKRLERFGYKVFSQTDEDGIIAEIFRRIGETNRTFVEFGSGPGAENNTIFLLYKNWQGLWIEGDAKGAEKARHTYGNLIRTGQLSIKNDFVSPDNINKLITEGGIAGEIDLLSIDIDGNDYHVLDAIACISPRVIVAEYNAKLPPPVEWVMPYDPSHSWQGTDYFGVSLAAYVELATRKGYKLVCTNLYGLNAFFVRADIAENKFAEDGSADALYNKPRYHLVPFVKSGYPTHSGTIAAPLRHRQS
jgi:hypothetical protein